MSVYDFNGVNWVSVDRKTYDSCADLEVVPGDRWYTNGDDVLLLVNEGIKEYMFMSEYDNLVFGHDEDIDRAWAKYEKAVTP